jgi:DNA-binding CsgD family transcriptional regulator
MRKNKQILELSAQGKTAEQIIQETGFRPEYVRYVLNKNKAVE